MKAQEHTHPSGTIRDNSPSIYIGMSALILIVVVSAGIALIHFYQQAQRQAYISSQNLAASMEQTFAGLIDTVDIALLASADEITRQLATGKVDAPSITRYLMQQRARLPHVAFMQAANERGEIIYGSGILSPPYRNDDQDYFGYLRDNPAAGLFVARPVIGRVDNKWTWVFARRINRPDGSFAGVILAGINIEEIEQMLARIQIEPGGSIALRDAELGLIARKVDQFAKSIPPGDKKMSQPFLDALQANPEKGSYISGATSIDSVSRIHSYRRNAKYGFTLNVGVSVESALATWRRQAWVVSGMVTAFILVLLAYARQNSRARQSQKKQLAELEGGQQVLRESEARFRMLFEQAAVGVALIRSDTGQFVRVNQKYCDIVGYSRVEMEQRDFQTITHPDDLAGDLTNMEWLKAGKIREFTMEKRYFRKDGSLVWVNLTVSPMWSPGEQPSLHVAVVEDITARKQAEEALKKSQQLLAESQRIGSVGGWEVDINSGKLTWTEEVYRIHEMDPGDDLNVEKGINFYAPTSRPVIEQAVQRAIELGEPFDVELEIITTKGNLRNVHAIGKADKKHSRIYGYFQDITERKQVEQAMRVRENQLALIYDNVFDIIFVVGVEPSGQFRFISVNRKFLEATGLPEDRIVGKLVQNVIPEPSWALALGKYNEAIQNRQTIRWEEVSVYPSGEKVGEVSISPVFDAAGICTQLIGAVHDITARKQAEAALQQSERKFRRLHETMTDAYVLVDMAGRIRECNQSYCAMLGYTEEELRQLTYVELTPEKWHTFEARIVQEQILPQGFSGIYEKEYQKKDGTVFPVELRVTLVRDDAGQPAAMHAIVRDITERKQAAHLIKASEERYHQLFENMSSGVAIYQPDAACEAFIFKSVNRAVERIEHVNREEVLGRSVEDCFPGVRTFGLLEVFKRNTVHLTEIM